MQTVEECQPASNHFLVRITICEGDPCDADEIRRAILYLGGEETGEGFAFRSAAARMVALELLGDRYGSRYVTAVHVDTQGKSDEGDAETVR